MNTFNIRDTVTLKNGARGIVLYHSRYARDGNGNTVPTHEAVLVGATVTASREYARRGIRPTATTGGHLCHVPVGELTKVEPDGSELMA